MDHRGSGRRLDLVDGRREENGREESGGRFYFGLNILVYIYIPIHIR